MIRNYTGRPLRIVADGGRIVTLPALGRSYLRTTKTETAVDNGVHLFDIAELGLVDLPDPVEGVWYVVNSVVAQYASRTGRSDVVFPGAREYDGDGRTVGVKALMRIGSE